MLRTIFIFTQPRKAPVHPSARVYRTDRQLHHPGGKIPYATAWVNPRGLSRFAFSEGFEVTNCDFKIAVSPSVNWKTKSLEKRSGFLLTKFAVTDCDRKPDFADANCDRKPRSEVPIWDFKTAVSWRNFEVTGCDFKPGFEVPTWDCKPGFEDAICDFKIATTFGYHSPNRQPGRMPLADQPAIKLWAAVLTQAIEDLESPVERGGAMEWLKTPGDEIGSFGWVADVLDMDPKRLRERILARDKTRRVRTRWLPAA